MSQAAPLRPGDGTPHRAGHFEADPMGAGPELLERIAANPYRFDFFQAVRLIENGFQALPRIGESISPKDDPVRFAQNPSLAFAPSTLESFEPATAAHPPRIFASFLGLFGPNGALPFHITEYARERRLNAHDSALAAFFNIFHHRMLSLFYRTWAVNQKAVDMDRPEKARFAVYLGTLFGIGMKSLRERDSVHDWAKLHYSGRLACQTRNAEGLAAIIADYFGIRTAIRTFAGQWLALPPDSICRLGETPLTGSLGMTAIVGSQFWDCQLKFRLRMGPMALADLERLLPVNEAFRRLKDWVLNYTGREFFWDVQLVLKAAEVPETRLGSAGLLGWTTWLKSKPFQRDAEDLILRGDP